MINKIIIKIVNNNLVIPIYEIILGNANLFVEIK